MFDVILRNPKMTSNFDVKLYDVKRRIFIIS